MTDRELKDLVKEIKEELEIVSEANILHELNKGKTKEEVISYYLAKEDEASIAEVYLGGDNE